MYLFRLPNSVYYTRIVTSLSLRERGYPKELKLSLLTRERKVAYLRNIEQVQLILTPRGDDNDWSKDFRDDFGDVLDAIGFQAGKRPTAYSLRHTFIDELKQAHVEEHIVVQIVGHKQEGMTFGRYGKMLPVELLVDAVNRFELDDSIEIQAL